MLCKRKYSKIAIVVCPAYSKERLVEPAIRAKEAGNVILLRHLKITAKKGIVNGSSWRRITALPSKKPIPRIRRRAFQFPIRALVFTADGWLFSFFLHVIPLSPPIGETACPFILVTPLTPLLSNIFSTTPVKKFVLLLKHGKDTNFVKAME
jgi:hypothetical protein